jgi:aspartate racemase
MAPSSASSSSNGLSRPASGLGGAPVIGILGGMGPHAALDLAQNVLELTRASSDHDHLPVALLNYPARIPDRSTYLFGAAATNPAYALADVMRALAAAGATVAGMPCNTAHAPAIFDVIEADLARTGHRIRLLHMIRETVDYLREATADGTLPPLSCIGTLSTQAVYAFGLHRRPLEAAGFDVVVPSEAMKAQVNRVIFDDAYGLKAQSLPPTPRAQAELVAAIEELRARGADAVILGCTELPLSPLAAELDIPLIDPSRVLARALIRATYPHALAAPDAVLG